MNGFNHEFGEAYVRIWHAPQTNPTQETMLHKLKWPLPSWRSQPRNILVVEPVITFSPPVGPANEFYLLKLEIYSEGNWKSGWMFEGVTITRAAD